MNAQHTPGPWTLRQGYATWFVTAPSENGSASETTIAEFREAPHGALHSHRARADAALFAAAPELLDALRAMLDLIDGFDTMTDDGPLPSVQRARAVLAKAEG